MPTKRRQKEIPPNNQTGPPSLLPSWPSLYPLVPTADLSLETILDDQVIVVRKLFTSTLCKNYVSFLSSLPLVTTPGQPKKGNAARVNDRFQVDDPAFAELLWRSTGLHDLVTGVNEEQREGDVSAQRRKLWGGEVCGLNPRIHIYRYSKGQFFDQHYDESVPILLPTNPPTPAKTTWTLLLYLTSPATGCIGGETVFYPELGAAKAFSKASGKSGKESERTKPIVVGLEVGMALLHKHGQECLLHEGREVVDGEKWVIRSDLCVRR